MRSGWGFVEPQSFSFSHQKACILLYSYARRDEIRRLTSESAPRFQEEGGCRLHLCKIRTPPLRGSREVTKRKVEDGMRESSQGRNIFLERSYSVKVRVEELKGFLSPEDVDVDFRRLLKEARDERGARSSKSSVRIT